MRTTIALDDDLIRTAQEYTGTTEKTALIREALKALIEKAPAAWQPWVAPCPD
jgi:Arc/MetJ family transcription regulator